MKRHLVMCVMFIAAMFFIARVGWTDTGGVKPDSAATTHNVDAPPIDYESASSQPVSTEPSTEPAKNEPTTKPEDGVLRVDAGSKVRYIDPVGYIWKPDRGFKDGQLVDRGKIHITGTKKQDIYRSEHYAMTEWSAKVPNGKYLVRLYFCETFKDITGPGQRVFTVTIGNQSIKDIDIFQATGNHDAPLIKTMRDVEVTNGRIKIEFIKKVQSPEINGIEVAPED